MRGYRGAVASEVGIRQMRAEAAATVRRAGAGEHLVITIDGRPVASLGPLSGVDGQVRLADLVAQGLVIAPRRIGDWVPRNPIPVWSGSRVDRLLREIR